MASLRQSVSGGNRCLIPISGSNMDPVPWSVKGFFDYR